MSAMETIKCPHCGEALSLPDEYTGRMVQCPRCSNRFTAGNTEIASGPARASLSREWDERDRDERDRDERDRDEEGDMPRPGSRRRRRYEDYDDDISIHRGYVKPHRGGAVLAIAIVGIIFCGIVLGPCAWIMGASDLKEMSQGRMDPEGEGLTRAGMIVGIVVTVLAALGICLLAVILASDRHRF